MDVETFSYEENRIRLLTASQRLRRLRRAPVLDEEQIEECTKLQELVAELEEWFAEA